MDRDQASFLRHFLFHFFDAARRTSARRGSSSSVSRRLLQSRRVLGTGSVALVAALGPALPAAANSPTPEPAIAQGSSSTPPSALRLVSQTAWVKPGQTFDLTLAIGSTVARGQLGIALSVYAPPNGQSSFDETLQGNTSSESLVSDTQTVPLESLTTNSSGNVEAQAGISAGNYVAPQQSFNLDLQCAPQTCNGVYPLRVQLMNTATGSVVSDFVTHIVFAESSVRSRLKVALMVPLGTEPSEPTETGVPGPPTGTGLDNLSTTVSELSNSAAALTVLAQPETLQGLEGGSPVDARSVADGIVALSDEAALQVLPSTYVWVDPKTLVDNGLSDEVGIRAQARRGAQVMDSARVQTSGNATVVQGAIDDETLGVIDSTGISQVVLPSDDVAPVTGRFAGPSVQTFELPVAQGRTVEAAQTDPALQSELTDQQGAGEVLAAHQLLADLALVAFEEPEASWARGVVLAPPLDWSPAPGFLQALLAGLASIPVLEPVTLSSFFAQVSRGDDGGNPDNGNGWPSARQLAKPSAEAQSAFPADALNQARTRFEGLKSIVHTAGNLTPLSDLLLSSESVLLSNEQQRAAISAFDDVVAQRADVVSLTADHTFRLTSRTATIPITLVRQVSYPVTVVLELSSDKLAFLHGTNPLKVTLTQHIQSVDIDVSARTSGDFPVVVTLRSPTGGLVIASAKFTVRSLSTSVVAIVLTIVAAVVLLMWWARTLLAGRRGRRARRNHGAHSVRRREEPTPAGAEAGTPGAGP